MRKILFSLVASSLLLGGTFAFATNGQCSSLEKYYTSSPKGSSISGENLCSSGSAGTVTYNTSQEQWTYSCNGSDGGTNDLCVVTLDSSNSNNDGCRVVVTDQSGTVPFSTSILCSGQPSGKVAIVVSKNGKILDATSSDSETYNFDDSGIFTVSCYPDVVNNRSNVCKTTVIASGQCGNGIVESDEQCDDGNQISGDGCNSACQIEGADGAVCGNGVVEKGEQCDEGSLNGGDTCTSLCQNTAPNTGPVSSLIIITLLSIGGGTGYYFYRKRKIVA